MDFLSDQLFDGRKIRVLTIVDNFTRVSPAIDVRLSYRGVDVVATLERVATVHGRPKRIRVDNGPEFISKELDLWAWLHGVEARLLAAGQADRQRLRGVVQWQVPGGVPERLLVPRAWTTPRPSVKLGGRDYNEDRPHSAIGNQTPIAWAFASGQACLT